MPGHHGNLIWLDPRVVHESLDGVRDELEFAPVVGGRLDRRLVEAGLVGQLLYVRRHRVQLALFLFLGEVQQHIHFLLFRQRRHEATSGP